MDRLEYWSRFVRENKIETVAEIGVWRGDFAYKLLSECPEIKTYYLVDPWQMLDDWNKPLNRDDLEAAFEETKSKLAAFNDKTVILRGRTTEVADQLPDLDFAYIDGDHTLRGIVLDMMRVWPKIKPDGWMAGDDFSPTIWQHSRQFEPTMVFPYAVHFAEGVDAPIEAPIPGQFLLQKRKGFVFNDPKKTYPSTEVLPQVAQMKGGQNKSAKQLLKEAAKVALGRKG